MILFYIILFTRKQTNTPEQIDLSLWQRWAGPVFPTIQQWYIFYPLLLLWCYCLQISLMFWIHLQVTEKYKRYIIVFSKKKRRKKSHWSWFTAPYTACFQTPRLVIFYQLLLHLKKNPYVLYLILSAVRRCRHRRPHRRGFNRLLSTGIKVYQLFVLWLFTSSHDLLTFGEEEKEVASKFKIEIALWYFFFLYWP